MLLVLTHAIRCIILFVAIAAYAQQYCNNAESLCNKRYDEVTHLGAHDSFAVRTPANNFSISGDQFYNSTTQLDSGVRLLTVQLHQLNGEYRLCHTLCQLLDAGTLKNWLGLLKTWLDSNKNDVVTLLIVNSDDVDAATLGSLYKDAGVEDYSFAPTDVTTPLRNWPTLSDMITQNKRLVTFVASLDAHETQAAPYLLDEYTFAFENSVNNIQPSDFSCGLDRPSSSNSNTARALADGMLPIMNHFRYDDINGIHVPSVSNVETTNAASGGPGNMGQHANECAREYGRNPTFILADFVNVAASLDIVDMLNDVAGKTMGRLALPKTVQESKDMPEISAPSPSAMQTSTSTDGEMQSSVSASSITTSTARSPSSGAPGRVSLTSWQLMLAISVSASVTYLANGQP